MPPTISDHGVRSYHDAPATDALAAAATICAALSLLASQSASPWTPTIGNREASVTMPNPDSEEEPLPAAAAIPIPSDSTSGTVTGPVVTAPLSQARPSTLESSGSLAI